MKFASYAWGVILVLLLIVTPVSCQYIEKQGPDWIKRSHDRTDPPGALFLSTALAMCALAGGAFACFFLPNSND